MSADERIPAALRALAEHGVHDATVDVKGHQREIAVIRVPDADEWERMMGPDCAPIVEAVKAAGFRYVALDLAPAEGDADDADDDDGPAGWDAFPAPDDAAPAPRPSPHPSDRGQLRSIATILAGLAAVQVLRYAISPNALPPQALALQCAVCAGAGFLAARAGRLRVRDAIGVLGACVLVTFAAQAVASLFGIVSHVPPVTVGQTFVPALAAAAAWLAGGWIGSRRRISRHTMA